MKQDGWFIQNEYIYTDMVPFSLGELNALRQVKKDISEAKKGLECGMSFEGFDQFQAGDVIQHLQTIETKQKL